MAKIADLLVRISADNSDLRRKLDATQRQIKDKFGGSAIASSQKALSKLKYLTAGFIGAGVASIKLAANVEQTKMAFETLLGSAEKADAMVRKLTDFAAKTPFQLPGVTKSTQQLLAYGFTAESVIPMLTSVGDAVSGLGGDDEMMQSVIRALGQMKAKAKVSAEEMKQLGEQGINAWQYLSEAAGKSISETQELAKKGAFNAEATIKAILDGMAKQFKGGMEKQSQTVNGLLSTIKDNVVGAARVIGEGLTDAFDLKGVLKRTNAYLTQFTALAEKSGFGKALKEMVPDSLKMGVIGLASAYSAKLAPALYMAATNAVKANSAFLPMIGIVGGIYFAIAELSGVTDVLSPLGESFLQSGIAAIGAYKGISVMTSALQYCRTEWVKGTFFLRDATSIVAKMGNAFTTARLHVIEAGGAMGALKGTVYGLAAAFKSLLAWMGPVGWMALAIGGGVWLGMQAQMKEAERQAGITQAAIEKVNGEFANADSSAIEKAIKASEKKLADLEAQAKKTTSAMSVTANVNTGHKKRSTLKNVQGNKENLEAVGKVRDQIAAEKARQKELGEIYKRRKELEDQLNNVGNLGKIQLPDLLGAGGDDKAAKKQQREYERLVEKAKDTSDRIEDEWIEMTGTKMDVLDKWYADETKAVNENYQRDLTRLEETYSEKRRKILHDEAKERQRTMEEIVRGYSDIRGELAKGSLEGADLDLYEMRKEAEDSYRSVSDFFAKIIADYADGTEQQKQNIRDALKKAGVEFVQTEKDTLDFTAELNAVHVEKEKQLYDDFVRYYSKCKDIQANIDRAYNNNSFAQLKAALSRENALRLSAFEAQRKSMELYQDSWTKANVSGAEQAIDVLDGTRDSFKTFFSDVLTGAKDFGEAFGDFFKSLWADIVDSFAEKWSNQIVNNLLGNMLGQEGGLLGNLFGFDSSQIQQQIAQETTLSSLKIANISAETAAFTAGEATKSAATIAGNEAIAAAAAASLAAQTVASSAAAAAIASAWAPAAAAVSLASFGKNAAPAMAGITATHALSQTLAKGGGGAIGNSVKGAAAFASGGCVSGPGSGTSDSIPAMLSNGEYVVRASAVERLGVPFLDRLNYGGTDIFNTVNRFASGGCVGVPVIKSLDMPGFAAGGYVSLADASITVPEFRAEPERIDLAALSVPAKLLKALVAGHTGERRDEAAEMEVNIYGDINNSADEKRLLNKMNAKMRAALMGGY
ncbi:tape measure protein [Synergistes jonesii]|uniref:Tape measure protein N-terminal domain-containing protein n=1 Tax=Synergistes jonesii TaxID=2754 RepID=A0A073J0E4_9BACT|nr:tape measure protein [Synergistes jonesii]KEJ91137.1 hypothetical protein EH55_13250 [Synergistes jonesii]OFB60246.1 hypothetical protein JS73_13060 [Synergistes jonesii]OFB60932.1 hypothetical protein JS79_12700 [Synergistes jonesii]OFB64615.1 hypothetical protein JS72_04000 [Synergistes jonesii]OFB66453.1 hypothetical protein JS78_13080 [Synergistes jonesii]